MTQLYQHIARCLTAQENCRKTGNTEWLSRHGDYNQSSGQCLHAKRQRH